MAAEQGLNVDEDTFRQLMSEQRERARADALAKRSGHADTRVYQQLAGDLSAPRFVGDDQQVAETRVAGIVVDGEASPAAGAHAAAHVSRRETRVYGGAGVHLAEHGRIRLSGGGIVEGDDAQSPIRGLPVHRGRLVEGSMAVDERAHASIATGRREAISRGYTATHMVHKAVREALGDTASQAGSENAPSRMRFDFRSGSGLPAGALQEVEERVNLRLMEDLEVTDEVMSLSAARDAGAMALFGEKYGERVRVVSVGGEWSKELCGGTHVSRSGEIGRVTLLGEASIGSGIRRIDALVGAGAYEFHAREHAMVGQLSQLLNTRSDDLPDRISSLLTPLKDAEQELASLQQTQPLGRAPEIAAGAKRIGRVRAIVDTAGDLASADDLRTLTLDVRERLGEEPAVVALFGVAGGRPLVVVATNSGARVAGVAAGRPVRGGDRKDVG